MGFNIFFTVEMLLRMMGLGTLPPMGALRYFREPWNVFDAFMVACGWLQFIPEQSGKNLQSLKALRALRPLRAISRFESTKFVVRGCIAVSGEGWKRGYVMAAAFSCAGISSPTCLLTPLPLDGGAYV